MKPLSNLVVFNLYHDHVFNKDLVVEKEELKKKRMSTEPPDSYCDQCLNAPECANKCGECYYEQPTKFQSIDSHTMVEEGYYP